MSVAEPLLDALSGAAVDGRTRQHLHAYPIVVDGKQRKSVACDECGNRFPIADRTLRERRSLGKQLLCRRCVDNVPVVPTEQTRRYWDHQWAYGHITLQEAVEIAEGIWGPRSGWT